VDGNKGRVTPKVRIVPKPGKLVSVAKLALAEALVNRAIQDSPALQAKLAELERQAEQDWMDRMVYGESLVKVSWGQQAPQAPEVKVARVDPSDLWGQPVLQARPAHWALLGLPQHFSSPAASTEQSSSECPKASSSGPDPTD
jgi:hypothetical protein